MLMKLFVLLFIATTCAAITQLPNIIRPCNFNDHKCIRDNFRLNSRCKRQVRGFIPAVVTIPRIRFETPAFNSSYVDSNLIIRGLNRCFVSEFFINRHTDSGVIALDCPQLNFESKRTMFQHNSLREDGVFHYSINGTYPLIHLTTSLARFDKLDLCQEFTFADVVALPTFQITPEDTQTKNYLTRDLSALGIFERETFLYRANLLARTVINSIICDFGCN